MHPSKTKKLEQLGFRIGHTKDFLQLSEEDAALIDLKITLFQMLRESRQHAGVTQQQLAKAIGSSQSRVAKMESGDPTVTLDLLCKALFALGVSRRSLGKMIASRRAA